jgi:hypothetical protein
MRLTGHVVHTGLRFNRFVLDLGRCPAAAWLSAGADNGRAPAPCHADGEGRSHGFGTRPVSLAFIIIIAIIGIAMMAPAVKRQRGEITG